MLTLIFFSNPVTAINKCTFNKDVSHTIYTDSICPNGATSTLFTQQIIQPNDPVAAKKRYLSDQKKLQQINQQKIKEENQQKHEESILARQIKQHKDHEYKCKEFDLKRKSALQQQSEIQRKGNINATKKARARAKQAENKYAHYCNSDY